MNKLDTDKIRHFMNDVPMNNAVHEVLLDAFLKPKDRGNDTQTLAAARIAIDLLSEGWDNLGKVQRLETKETPIPHQVGL